MRVLGIVGSMRKNRHTNTLVSRVISDMTRIDPDVVADVIYVAEKTIHPCRVVCSEYCSHNPYQCLISDDVTKILHAMMAADVLVIGAPLYFRAPPAKFHAMVERLISIVFFREIQGGDVEGSPLRGKPCGLIGVAEYSNPHQILEYLHDFCSVVKMRPVVLERFPYLGVAGQGEINEDDVFHPFDRCKDLAGALVEAVQKQHNRGDAEV